MSVSVRRRTTLRTGRVSSCALRVALESRPRCVTRRSRLFLSFSLSHVFTTNRARVSKCARSRQRGERDRCWRTATRSQVSHRLIYLDPTSHIDRSADVVSFDFVPTTRMARCDALIRLRGHSIVLCSGSNRREIRCFEITHRSLDDRSGSQFCRCSGEADR